MNATCKRGVFLVFALVWASAQALFAQHPPMFSQYMFNGLTLNPAYTGSRDALSVLALYRHQWAGMVGAPRTQNLSLHTPLKRRSSNLGFNFVHDRLGVSSHTSLYATYAYRIDMGERAGRLAFGLQGGVSMLQDRWTEVNTLQGGDNVFVANSPTYWVPRAGFGIYYDHRRWFVGASLPFLLEYRNALYSDYITNSLLYKPWLINAGLVFRLNPFLLLKPSVLYKHLANSPDQFDINLNLVIKEALWIGGSYRTGDGIVAMLEYQLNPQFRIGYAFDYALTELQRYHNGSHELMLRYEFGYLVRAVNPRYF